jgi:glycosyltransferase involved in cell wall biosynthesis
VLSGDGGRGAPVTLLVEPDPGGHRFQAVANVARLAARDGEVLVLTSKRATADDAFRVYLSDAPVQVEEVFDEIYPPTARIVAEIAARCRTRDVRTVVVMDADQSLKWWWRYAPRAFRGLPRRPRVVFFLTRYPARLRITDGFGWKLRVAKATLALVAMTTGSLHRVAGFAGREDLSRGWLVKRARDPEICGAHSRDRAALRAEFGLPVDRHLVGIFGVISERKNAHLIWEAMQLAGADADLLLAGSVQPEVKAWIAALPGEQQSHVQLFDGFLSNDVLDKLVAAVDVAPIALTNNGPSGIMGKALAAGVPVVSAGSRVRARELLATGAGELADLEPASLGAAIGRVLSHDPSRPRVRSVPPATAEEFAAVVLGVDQPARRSQVSAG